MTRHVSQAIARSYPTQGQPEKEGNKIRMGGNGAFSRQILFSKKSVLRRPDKSTPAKAKISCGFPLFSLLGLVGLVGLVYLKCDFYTSDLV